MSGSWRRATVGWTIALTTGGLASGAAALAAAQRPARPSGARASVGHPPPCPQKEPQVSGQSWPPAEHRLAPRGASEIRLCRYSSLNSHPPLTVVRVRLVDRAGLVARLVREFDGLPPEPPGVFSCPADDGSKIVALLSYPGAHQVQISVGLKGCELVTNGDLNRTAAGYRPHPRRGPRLLAELERLVGGSTQPGTAG